MNFMRPEKRLANALLFAISLSLTFAAPGIAQTKKPAAKPAAKSAAKTAATAKKDAAKVTAKAATNNSKASQKTTSANPKNAKNATVANQKNSKAGAAVNNRANAARTPVPARKLTAKELAEQRKIDERNKRLTPAQRRAEAEKRRQEEARRQAAIAEQRRREQAAREARARAIAFENGLKEETAANILKDNTEGEDLRVRQAAVNALGSRAGTVVVMDAKSGRIVTMVNQDWAVRHGFKPCSTIKLVTGVAGINEGLINGDGHLTGSGGGMDLDDALARSNNPYFQRVGANLGNEKMIEYARRLGLGQPTGINISGENPGRLPFGNNNPRIYSHADDFEVTPLQLAVMVTAIANGGERIVPKMSNSRVERTSLKPTVKGKIELPDRSVQGVIPGMIGAAEYGTARRGVDAGMGVAGKTGSCIGKGSWVGLFASVAPVEDPKYAVVVITRGQGERGRIAAGIAGEIYKALAGDISRDPVKSLALKQIRNRTVNPLVSNSVAAVDGDEEDEDAPEAETKIEEGRRIVVAGSSSRPTNAATDPNKKTVTKTSQSKPVFPPVVIPYKKEDSATDQKKPAQSSRPRVIPNER